MKIVKTCNYRMHCYSLTPGVIITPLRCQPPRPTPEFLSRPLDNPVSGFRLAFKFINRHIGVEVHL